MAHLTRAWTAVALIIALSLLVAGCGGAARTTASTPVTATSYVTALCKAVAPFEQDVASRSRALSDPGTLSASAGKRELVSYLGALSADSSQAVARLQAAGAPQVSGGATFARQLLSTFTRLDTAMARSKQLAAQLSTASPAAFKTSATRLTTAVKASVGALGSGLSTQGNKALDQAAAKVSACHTL